MKRMTDWERICAANARRRLAHYRAVEIARIDEEIAEETSPMLIALDVCVDIIKRSYDWASYGVWCVIDSVRVLRDTPKCKDDPEAMARAEGWQI